MMSAALPVKTAVMILFLLHGAVAKADETTDRSAFNGYWITNEELSDDTDRQVERAILRAGGRIQRGGRQGKGRYRGGPEEHALYDHISYDEELHFHYSNPEFRLVYDEGFERIFYSDNRGRTVSASGTSKGDGQDFSFASWDNGRLIVESRVRDGGWILETYTLESGGEQLQVMMELKPTSFREPISLTRVYNRNRKTVPLQE